MVETMDEKVLFCMNEPIKTGDRCEVVEGVFGKDSPNLGKIVTVISYEGDHSVHGRIWMCRGKGLATEYGGVGEQTSFAQSWLRKLPPEILPPKVVNEKLTA